MSPRQSSREEHSNCVSNTKRAALRTHTRNITQAEEVPLGIYVAAHPHMQITPVNEKGGREKRTEQGSPGSLSRRAERKDCADWRKWERTHGGSVIRGAEQKAGATETDREHDTRPRSVSVFPVSLALALGKLDQELQAPGSGRSHCPHQREFLNRKCNCHPMGPTQGWSSTGRMAQQKRIQLQLHFLSLERSKQYS